MTDARQLDILKRLTLHLEEITQANGFDFDMDGKVCRGRMVIGDDDPVPLLAINEHLQPDIVLNTAGENNDTREETWILLVQGWVDSAKAQFPTDEAYQLKANVMKKLYELIAMHNGDPLFPTAYKLGLTDTITNLSIGPGIVSGPREGVSSKAFFYLPLGVGLVTDLADLFVP